MFKKFLKILIPARLIKRLKNLREKIEFNRFKNLGLEDVFKTIYEEKIWTPESEKKNFKYYSGLGSHKNEFTEKYILETINVLKSIKKNPDVVELGCGDFKVSEKLVKFSNSFKACDIFNDLIENNKKKFKDPKLQFFVLDMTKDELPSADICIIRCVLQHLSNKKILNFLTKINGKFKFLLITEHYPNKINFSANHDIISGPNIRLKYDSAVDLTKAPFNLKVKSEKNIYKAYSKDVEGFLNTQLYELE